MTTPLHSVEDKKKMGLPIGVPVTDVTVIVGYVSKDGSRQEVIHDIHNVRIASCVHQVDEKLQKAKDEEGNFIGFEPTGEYSLTLKVKYLKE
jgi:hypothetical protein